MFIHEYGSRDDPTIILLAPMMVAGSDLYQLMKPHLEDSYHIIAPDQGGHGKAGVYPGFRPDCCNRRRIVLDCR